MHPRPRSLTQFFQSELEKSCKLPCAAGWIRSFVGEGGTQEMDDLAGVVCDTQTYTLPGLATALGYRQARSLERLLIEIGCPVARLGKKKLISGRQFRESIERANNQNELRTHPALDVASAKRG